jgi:hypothetical protein
MMRSDSRSESSQVNPAQISATTANSPIPRRLSVTASMFFSIVR